MSISYEIQEAINKQINEDKIAYIALHVGCFLESEPSMLNVISCAFVYNVYYNLFEFNIDLINKKLGEQLSIDYTTLMSNTDNKFQNSI